MKPDPGAELAAAAKTLVGAPFRLHGRDPRSGLDCVGLVAESLRRCGVQAAPPSNYSMRHAHSGAWLHFAERNGFSSCEGALHPGDLLLVRTGPAQLHLMLAEATDQFIHADARLGKVVRMPGPLAWPVLKHWRLCPNI